ncbi:unnamed protein product [Calicophoron daubneyi]|uniref:RING-type domain-containing protein n=1 Tax=Calicophoron daubneyi TaxID=300641 RepID=A0AAV2U2R1_CALDB
MNSEDDQNAHSVCSICREDFDYYAYGACNHPTCVKCALKLRKFGSADEPDFSTCPTCRRKINRVVILKDFVQFANVDTSSMRHDPEYDFMFPSADVEAYYRRMLKSFCPICGEEKKSLSALNRHTTAEHSLSYCDLCIRYARLLPCEFTPMKPVDLAEHRKWDKQRKKGHPLCDFCKERFYEMEDLVNHIRDSHFLCDLCMTTGKFEVFREQWQLLQHYGDAHHLCAECRAQQRISCFATSDRLGMHRLQEHPNEVANDPNPWLPVTFELAPPSDARRRDFGPSGADVYSVGGVLSSSDGRLIAEGTERGVRFRRPNPEEWTGDDFPTLHTSSSGRLNNTTRENQDRLNEGERRGNAEGNNKTTTSANRPAALAASLAALAGGGQTNRLTADDFPSLPGSATPSTGSAPRWIKASGHRPPQPVAVRNGAPTMHAQVKPQTSDFPDLPSDSHRTSNQVTTGNANWRFSGRKNNVAETNSVVVESDKVVQTSKPHQPVPTGEDFPDLPGGVGGPPVSHKSRVPPALPPSHPRPPTATNQKKNSARKPGSHPPLSEPGDTPAPTEHIKTKLRQKRNPDVKFAFSQARISDDQEEDDKGKSQYSHIQTVDVLPQSQRRTDATVLSRADVEINIEDFPSLGTSDLTQKTSSAKPNPKQKPYRKAAKDATDKPEGESIVPKVRTPKYSKKGSSVQSAVVPNSLIDTECVLFAKTPYTPMTDADDRNKKLIQTVETALFDLGGKTAFSRFADLSRRYSHKQLTASAYMEGLVGLLTPRSGKEDNKGVPNGDISDSRSTPDAPLWMAEMIALLPDVGLQRALYRVLLGQGPPRIPAELQQNDGVQCGRRTRAQILPPPAWAKSVTALIQPCRKCGQVCLRVDMSAHLKEAHSLE